MPTARGHTHSLADWLSPKPQKCADHHETGLSAAGHCGKELAAASCTGRAVFIYEVIRLGKRQDSSHILMPQEGLKEKPVAFLTDRRGLRGKGGGMPLNQDIGLVV